MEFGLLGLGQEVSWNQSTMKVRDDCTKVGQFYLDVEVKCHVVRWYESGVPRKGAARNKNLRSLLYR